jgi:hypothetical protein
MSTIKSTETPELEQVSTAEDASIESVEQISENIVTEEPELLGDAPEQDDQSEVVVEYQIAGKSKAELVDMLAFILEQDLVEDVRHYVDEIKTAFYKLHRQQIDNLKAQAESEGEGAQAIMNLVENAWAGFGSAFGSVIILSLFWRRFTYKGALAGVIAGALTDILWLVFLSETTGIYEIIPGFAVSMIAAVVVTPLDKKPSEEITAIFDAATTPIED